MGNKTLLASEVGRVVDEVDPTQRRTLVDLFGGMCTIAGAVCDSGRPVWNNDIQQYATLVAQCLLTTADNPPTRDRAVRVLTPAYRKNLLSLRRRFSDELAVERRVLAGDSRKNYLAAYRAWRHAGNDDSVRAETERLRRRVTGPYRLATLTFAWGYFGLNQSIEIDSLRAAIDQASASGELSSDEAAWCRLAILQSCSRAASSPGHFAQYLRGETESSFRRIQSARRRSIWDGVLDDLDRLKPYGTKRWRARNRVLKQDALEIWPHLDAAGLQPAIFYADPPYSKEHYSRFYHVLETLELYDYPDSVGVGRYRSDRFATAIATKRGALKAAETLFAEVSKRDGTLILSYPSSGILTSALKVDLKEALTRYFGDVRIAISRPSFHSTLGSRHGRARQQVTEYVWTAT